MAPVFLLLVLLVYCPFWSCNACYIAYRRQKVVIVVFFLPSVAPLRSYHRFSIVWRLYILELVVLRMCHQRDACKNWLCDLVQVHDDGVGVENDFRPMERGKSRKIEERKKKHTNRIDVNEGEHI